ncbi:MAG: hypothetical protein AAGJ50_00400 [Pseudomonadota bacterium]
MKWIGLATAAAWGLAGCVTPFDQATFNPAYTACGLQERGGSAPEPAAIIAACEGLLASAQSGARGYGRIAHAHLALGRAYGGSAMGTYRYEKSTYHFETALTLSPTKMDWVLEYGTAQIAAGDIGAQVTLAQIPRGNPDYPAARLVRARQSYEFAKVSSQSLGRERTLAYLSSAVADYRDAVLEVKLPETTQAEARTLRQDDCTALPNNLPQEFLHHTVKACDGLERSLLTLGTQQLANYRGLDDNAQDRLYRAAITTFEELIWVNQGLAVGRLHLGVAHFKVSQNLAVDLSERDAHLDAALSALTAAMTVRTDPGHLNAVYRARADVHQAMGRSDLAARDLGQIVLVSGPDLEAASLRLEQADLARVTSPAASVSLYRDVINATTALASHDAEAIQRRAYLGLAEALAAIDETGTCLAERELVRGLRSGRTSVDLSTFWEARLRLAEFALARPYTCNWINESGLVRSEPVHRNEELKQIQHLMQTVAGASPQRARADFFRSVAYFERDLSPSGAQSSRYILEQHIDMLPQALTAIQSARRIQDFDGPDMRMQECAVKIAHDIRDMRGFRNLQALCAGDESSLSPETRLMEGAYYLRNALATVRYERRRNWENALSAFESGLSMADPDDASPVAQDTRTKLEIGLAQASYCLGLVEDAQAVKAHLEADGPHYRRARQFLTRHRIRTCE